MTFSNNPADWFSAHVHETYLYVSEYVNYLTEAHSQYVLIFYDLIIHPNKHIMKSWLLYV